MSSDFRTLTNQLIHRINESELSVSDFAAASGVHALCKDAVVAAVAHVYREQYRWPFNSTAGSQLLVVGQEKYTWPSDFSVGDWESFYVNKDSSLSTNTVFLRKISEKEWARTMKVLDYDSESTGRDVPRRVFPTNTGFGVTPSPNKAYTVSFDYHNVPTRMSAYDDTTAIPERFDDVIVNGSAFYLNLFRENEESASIMRSVFKDDIKNMRSLLINKSDDFNDTRVNN